jgi:hypothetical protein
MSGLVLMIVIAATSVSAADASPPVESGRKALQPRFAYPWYDSASDGLRRIDPRTESSGPSRLSDAAFDISAVLSVLAWTLLVFALLVVVYFLVQALRNRPDMRSEPARRPTAGDLDRIEALPLPVAFGRSDLLAQARRLYEEGNYGQAVIYLFSYQLMQLDKGQFIRLAKGKTNRQYLREVGSGTRLRQLVEQTMVVFEDVFFGSLSVDRQRFESCWSRVDEFQSLIVRQA